MRKIIFPPIEKADEDGLIAVGGDLEVDTMLAAYKRGIFPWPISADFPLAWFSPDPRGVIDVKDWHVPKSFLKWLRKSSYKVTCNTNFEAVIKNCATATRKNQHSTWITPDLINGYIQFFKHQYAYSIEVWNEDQLVGGLFGVHIGDYISGESMFSLETNTSKLALYTLLKRLNQLGFSYLDTQMVTPVVKSFNGQEMERNEFIKFINTLKWEKSPLANFINF